MAPALRTAINTAQADRLRRTLLSICDASIEASRVARKLLLVPENNTRAAQRNDPERVIRDGQEGCSEGEEQSDDCAITHVQKAPKRLRPRFATCINCDQEFDVTDNGDTVCSWHDGMVLRAYPVCVIAAANMVIGEREPDFDGDFWADHDEDCHGRITDLEDEFPEGFKYDCCGQAGDAEGCNTGPHEEQVSNKRARY